MTAIRPVTKGKSHTQLMLDKHVPKAQRDNITRINREGRRGEAS